ncbi:alpha/beta-hydrolase [Polychaeton citri CBS 116435]|uniref:Alpha/beta-hydrolase n=1 Tax=Polychaeton citri CBS 116435 TaxID=1314669 RepID=A0A9P4QC25_9PEZI|nr:alpha/beta-hydrolase [Polychaeton citri CBS 116435]
MAEFDIQNFHFIHEGNRGQSAAPLILIHDGGGTAFNYHLLGDLGRDVYAISNPHFDDGQAWKNGFPEMAACYGDMIRRNVGKGRMILGGWSLGGMTALELAWQLKNEPDYDVLGIVMLDSPFPGFYKTPPDGIRAEDLDIFPASVKPAIQAKVKQCLINAREMIVSWTLPDWTNKPGRDDVGATVGRDASDKLHAVFLHAKQSFPTPTAGQVAEVDVARQDETLGWIAYPFLEFISVRQVEGHHFNVFAPHFLERLTQTIRESCLDIEKSFV